LNAGDILYIASKRTGKYDAGGGKKICKAKFPSSQSFLSKDWFANNIGDFLLYKAVNHRLDLTNEHTIRRKKIDKAMKEHKYLIKLVQERCEPITICFIVRI